MHEILAQASQKAEQAEVYHLKRKVVPVQFDAQGLSIIKTRQSEGVALRTLCDGRLGYATSTDLEHPDEVVDAAVATARFGDVTELDMPATASKPLSGIDHQALIDLPVEALVDLGEQVQKAAALLRVQTRRRLVDDDQLGIAEQSLGDAEALSHSAGVRSQFLFANLPQVGPTQQAFHRRAAILGIQDPLESGKMAE